MILHYLRLCFWPSGQSLDYHWPVAQTLGSILGPLLVIGPLLVLAAWGTRRRWALGFLGAWFFLILAPTSSVMPILDLAFEHRMYLPLAAVAAAVVMGLAVVARDLKKTVWRSAFMAGVAVVAVLLTSLTLLRNRSYADNLTMWRDVLVKVPDNPRARFGLATAQLKAGDYGASERTFEELAEACPAALEDGRLQTNWAICLMRLNRGADAVPHFLEALAIEPDAGMTHLNFAGVLLTLNCNEAAVGELRRAVGLLPGVLDARLDVDPQTRDFALLILKLLAAARGTDPRTLWNQRLDACRSQYEFGVALTRAIGTKMRFVILPARPNCPRVTS